MQFLTVIHHMYFSTLGAGDIAATKKDKIPALLEFDSW